VHRVGFIIRIFKSNIQQISYSDISKTKSLFEGHFFPLYRWTNWFLHAVTVGSNPGHKTISTPVFVLHCESREWLYYWLIFLLTKYNALQSTVNKPLSIIWTKFQISLQKEIFFVVPGSKLSNFDPVWIFASISELSHSNELQHVM
jgi:hypothetical protein